MNSTDLANPSTTLDTLIVGAGITGLSIAQALHSSYAFGRKRGRQSGQILLTESQDRVGGRIVTQSQDGFLWEEGPNSCLPTPEFLKLAVDVGLKDELVLADRRLPRYVYWDGELIPVPMSPPAFFQTKLLSDWGKLRAIAGALGFVPPAIGATLAAQGGEETVAQFFGRHLGQEVLERLVQPFVSGVYAGDPNQLSASAAFGKVTQMTDVGGGLAAGAILSLRKKGEGKRTVDPSLPKVQRGELASFRQGLSALPKAIAAKLGDVVKLGWHLIQIKPTENQTYLAEFSTPSGPVRIETRSMVLTTPSYVSADLLANLAPIASQGLSKIPYPAVACVVLAYPESAFKTSASGFGNLIPRGQGIRTLGTIWSSSLFPHRAPVGWRLLLNFIGGTTDPALAQLSQAEIVQIVHQDLQKTLLKQDIPPKVLAVHLWKRAIPQYPLGHQQNLAQINQALQAWPGLFLCGNYTDGVGLGDCIRRGQQCAADVVKYLDQR